MRVANWYHPLLRAAVLAEERRLETHTTKTHMPATKVLTSLGLLAATPNALDNGQGLTPQMGYSSWNDCANAVTEDAPRRR